MVKYMAHPNHSPTVPRAVRPEHYSRWHLTGFTFYHGDPMLTNTDVHDFLQKAAFMPWRKSRGESDSYLRFETTLRILFEVVVFFGEFWGQRGFWPKIHTLLKLDSTVSADTLEDTVKLYCKARRNCLKKVPWKGEPPGRIAELAETVNGLHQGEHTPISLPEWDRRAHQWWGKLYSVLCD